MSSQAEMTAAVAIDKNLPAIAKDLARCAEALSAMAAQSNPKNEIPSKERWIVEGIHASAEMGNHTSFDDPILYKTPIAAMEEVKSSIVSTLTSGGVDLAEAEEAALNLTACSQAYQVKDEWAYERRSRWEGHCLKKAVISIKGPLTSTWICTYITIE